MMHITYPKLAALSAEAAAGFGRRRFLTSAGRVAIGGVATGLLGGCDQGKDKSASNGGKQGSEQIPASLQGLVSAAQKEEKLVLYTGSEESIVARVGKAFQDKYNVSLEYQRLNSGEIASRYSAEAQAGKTVADLILTGDHALFDQFASKGWLAKLKADAVPGLDAWPQEYWEDYTVTVSIAPYTIAINTQLVTDTPKDWQYLIDPSLKGAIVTLDLKRVNLVAYAAWDLLLKLYGDDFLKKIGEQQLRLFDSAPSAVQQLASGAGKVYFACSATQAASMAENGAPVKGIVPDNVPFTGVMSPVGMSTDAPHANAARLFISFLLSEEGQKLLNVVSSSPNNTPGSPPLGKGFVRPDLNSSAANRDRIIQLLAM